MDQYRAQTKREAIQEALSRANDPVLAWTVLEFYNKVHNLEALVAKVAVIIVRSMANYDKGDARWEREASKTLRALLENILSLDEDKG